MKEIAQKGEMFNGTVRLSNISCPGHKRITTGKSRVLHARSTEFEFEAMYKPTPLSVLALLAQFISLDSTLSKATAYVNAVMSSLQVCMFSGMRNLGIPGIPESGGVNFEDFPRLLEALAVNYDVKELYGCGERIWRLEMAYNAREGLRREHF